MMPPMLKIGLVLAALLLVAAGVWLFLRRRSHGTRESVCGKCGYVVSGLPTFTCPECGSDLRQVGIGRRRVQTPAASRDLAAGNLRLYLILAIWTLVYGALYLFLGARSYPKSQADLDNRPIQYGLIDTYLWPYQGRSTHSVTLTPRSGAYRRLIVTEEREARFRGWKSAPQLAWTGDSPNAGLTKFTMTVQVDTLEGKSATLEIDPASLGWRFENPEAPGQFLSGNTPLTTEVVWGWMVSNGVTMPSEFVKDEAATVVDLLTRSSKSGHVGGPVWATGRLERITAQQRNGLREAVASYAFEQTKGTASDAYGPAWSIYWLSIPFGLGIYSYGVNWIYWRERKRRRRERAAQQAVALDGQAARKSKTLTVLFTDLKDYTAHAASTSRDGLLALLKTNRELVERAIRRHGGTIIKTIGDAYLATFESATDGVLAGVDIQKAAAKHNQDAPSGQRMELRIALCTGEVTLLDGDVFGTPVNMASRVQALAQPGEVCFTESTRHAINAPEIPHEAAGKHELKGLPGEVQIYRAVPPQ